MIENRLNPHAKARHGGRARASQIAHNAGMPGNSLSNSPFIRENETGSKTANLADSSSCKIAIACADSGITCWRLFFARAAGNVQVLPAISTSAQRISADQKPDNRAVGAKRVGSPPDGPELGVVAHNGAAT
jgi:hypothetical protein